MKADFVNFFIEAVINILETTAATAVKAKKPYLKKDTAARGDITCIIQLSGDLEGTVSVSFTQGCILGMVSNMFGEEMKEMNDEIKDAVGEFANMITGQVTIKFAELEKSLKFETSEIIMSNDHQITHKEDRPVIAMPYTTENGELTIEVCFEEK